MILGVFQSCETLDLDVVDSPNAVNPTTADVDLFINAISQEKINKQKCLVSAKSSLILERMNRTLPSK